MPEPALLVALGALLLVLVATLAARHREPSVRLTVTPNALPRQHLTRDVDERPDFAGTHAMPVGAPGDAARASLPIASGADPVLHRLLAPDGSAAEALTHPPDGVPVMVAVLAKGRDGDPSGGSAQIEWQEAETVGWPESPVFTPVSPRPDTEPEAIGGSGPAASAPTAAAGEAAPGDSALAAPAMAPDETAHAVPATAPDEAAAEVERPDEAAPAEGAPPHDAPAVAGVPAPAPPSAPDDARPAERVAAPPAEEATPAEAKPRGAADVRQREPEAGGSETATPRVSGPDADVALGPCERERRALEARSTEAASARAAHEAAAAEQRRLQREHDAAVARAEAADRTMDTRRIVDDKTAAHEAYRAERASARDEAALQQAAARWLTAISDINVRARAAQRVAGAERRRAARLAQELELAGPRVDAARIAAERADDALADARESLAECAERNAGAFAAAAVSGPGRAGGPGTGTAPLGPAPAASLASRPSLLSRILESDETAIAIASRALAPESIEQARRWHLELSAFRDALIETAVDAGLVDPAMEESFWSAFTPEEAREVASVLASLGYRYDGRDGFADARVPSTRDLALAVGYAGLDPLRIRRWPAAADLPGLLRGAHIAVVELVMQRAPDFTLSQFTDLLGPRARGLALLWDDWGRVRPVLASPVP